MRQLIADDTGIVSIWITLLLAIFGFSLIYALFYDILCVEIFNIAISIAPANTPQAYFDNINRFRIFFSILPFLAIFGMILWAYVQSQKREYT